MAKHCEMIVGFLVPHRCENRALAACAKCQRQYCEEHVSIVNGQLLCTACQQGLDEPILVAKTAEKFDEEDVRAFVPIIDDDYDSDDMFADLS